MERSRPSRHSSARSSATCRTWTASPLPVCQRQPSGCRMPNHLNQSPATLPLDPAGHHRALLPCARPHLHRDTATAPPSRDSTHDIQQYTCQLNHMDTPHALALRPTPYLTTPPAPSIPRPGHRPPYTFSCLTRRRPHSTCQQLSQQQPHHCLCYTRPMADNLPMPPPAPTLPPPGHK